MAVLGAVISAVCFSAGLGMILPVTFILLKGPAGLHSVIERYLLGSSSTLQDALGTWLLGWVPADPFHGFMLVMAVVVSLSAISGVGRYVHAIMIVHIVNRVIRQRQNAMLRRLVSAPAATIRQTGPQEMT
ncbi:MAG: hypothetical protein QGH33_02595, partial [Pirellulaceae bacterium]|nr:hypothetical protein [Pirellulaceae bacterium]